MADAKSLIHERLAGARSNAWEDVDIRDGHGQPTGFVVRYQAVETSDFDDLAENVELAPHEANLSLLIRGCQALLLRDDDGRLVSIDTDDPEGAYVDEDGRLHGRPLTYTSERTLELLDVADQREAVKLLHPAPGRIDVESTVIARLTGYGQGDAGPERRRSPASRS